MLNFSWNADMFAVNARLAKKFDATVAQVAEQSPRKRQVGSSSDPGSSSSEQPSHSAT